MPELDDPWEKSRPEFAANFNWNLKYRMNLMHWLMEALGKGGSYCDVGCLDGRYIAKLRTMGFRGQALGIDISPTFIMKALEMHPKEDFKIGNIHFLAEPDESWDTVGSFHVIDHVFKLAEAVKHLFRIAKRDVMISTLCSVSSSYISQDHDLINHHHSIASLYAIAPANWKPHKSALYIPEWDKTSLIFQSWWKKCA